MAHVLARDLRAAVLQAAMQGKLTEQLPEDGDARDLLADIKAEKERLIKEKKIKKEKPFDPIFQDEIPFDIPNNWCWIRLIDVCKSIADGDHQAPPQVSQGIPFLVISNVSSGSMDFSSTRFVPIEYYNRLSDERIGRNTDVLFTVTGSYGIVIPVDTDKEFCFQRHMALIKPLIYRSFLIYALKSPCIKMQCDAKVTGIAQKTLGIKSLKEIVIPIPPISEQHRIVARIEELMAKIDDYEKLEMELAKMKMKFPNDMKAAILQAAMEGKLTEQLDSDSNALETVAKIQNERAIFGKIKKYDTTQDEGLNLPINWEVIKLWECFALDKGEKVSGVHLPYLEAKYLRGKTKPTYRSAGSFVKAGTRVILVDGENSGEVFTEPIDGIMGSTFNVLFIPESINEQFALYLLDMYRSKLRENKRGAAIPHLNKELFFNIDVPIPPIEEQKRIVEKLDQLLPLCDELAELA